MNSKRASPAIEQMIDPILKSSDNSGRLQHAQSRPSEDSDYRPDYMAERPRGEKKILYILRGLPGVNKTGLAQEIAEIAIQSGVRTVAVLSTDDYFVNEQGKFHFNPHLLRNFHRRNMERAFQYFQVGTQVVVLDNPNIKVNHYYPYLKMAQLFDYAHQIILVGPSSPTESEIEALAKASRHKVPASVIRKFADEFEVPE